MATLSWDEILQRAKQNNKTVICEVVKRNNVRYFRLKCGSCEYIFENRLKEFHRCKNCHIKKNKSSTEEFIIKAKKIHGEKYNYDFVYYIKSHMKVKIQCNKCNNIFEQEAHSHLRGRGCKQCADNDKISDTYKFITKAKEIHGNKYNYDFVNYLRVKEKVKILCISCDKFFEQTPSCHLSGKGCSYCANRSSAINRSSNTEEFVKKAKEIHGSKYNYDLSEYVNNNIKIKIHCNKCNEFFYQIPKHHLKGHGCPKCNESKGENRVAKYLSNNNIKFAKNKIFKTLKDKRYLKPDFYLSELNLFIEYDGVGHYKATFGSTPEEKQKNFEDCQRRDKIKNEWAKANNIPLLRIPYWDFDRIEELIEAFILQHSKKEIKQLVMEI